MNKFQQLTTVSNSDIIMSYNTQGTYIVKQCWERHYVICCLED